MKVFYFISKQITTSNFIPHVQKYLILGLDTMNENSEFIFTNIINTYCKYGLL